MVTPGNTLAAGTVIGCAQYNAGAAPFQTKKAMAEYAFAKSGSVANDIIWGVECDPAKNSGSAAKYVRPGNVPAGQDIKTYDLGVFQLATTGADVDLNIGELWIDYKVKLRKPKLLAAGANPNIAILSAAANNQAAGSTIQDFLGQNTTGPVPIANINNVVTNVPGYDTSVNGVTYQTAGFKTIIALPEYVNEGIYQIFLQFDVVESNPGGLTVTVDNGSLVSYEISSWTELGRMNASIQFDVSSPAGTQATVTMLWDNHSAGIAQGWFQLSQLANTYPTGQL